MTPRIGRDFGAAVCSHFNLPVEQVDAKVVLETGNYEIFGVTLKIMLTADDLSAIAELMRASELPR